MDVTSTERGIKVEGFPFCGGCWINLTLKYKRFDVDYFSVVSLSFSSISKSIALRRAKVSLFVMVGTTFPNPQNLSNHFHCFTLLLTQMPVES